MMYRKAVFSILFCTFQQLCFGQGINVVDANGRKQGLWVTVQDSTTNTRMFSNYLDDALNGEVKILINESEIYRCLYKNGLKNGYESRYAQSGTIKESNVYDQDTLVSSMSFYSNGTLMEEMYYSNGLKHGSNRKYYTNGKIRQVTSFSNGKEEGYDIYFKKNGKVSLIFKYENGIVTETW